MLNFIVFLLILSFLVLIHELGHFIAAKRAGVRVEEFGLGIPPKLIGKKFGETLYVLNLLPLGGYVKLTGEDAEGNLDTVMKDQRSFLSKKAYVRACILVAGVFMNIVFAFIFYHLSLFLNDFKSTTIPLYVDYHFRFGQERRINTVITAVENGSPAQKAGISFGEAIIEVNDKPVYSITDFRSTLIEIAAENADQSGEITNATLPEIKVLLMNVKTASKDTRVVKLTPVMSKESRPIIGVLLGSAVTISYETKLERLFAGPMHAYNMGAYTLKIFSTLVSISVKEKTIAPVSSNISGPVGVFSVVSEILKTKGKDTILYLVDLTALLSLSLGIMNLLPIPALDGGRLAFVVVEMVTGKRISPQKEALVHKIGMAALLALIVLVTFKDVQNLF